jgi:hypothetical protein
MLNNKRALPKRYGGRNKRGGHIIEATCASLFLALFTCAVFDTMAAQSRLASMSKCQLFATTVAQTAVEGARSLPFEQLTANVGSHDLQIQADDTAGVAPNMIPRPVWQDRISLKYDDATTVNNFYKEHAKAVERIDMVNPNLARVTVEIVWQEAGHSRNLKLSALISRYGIHG